MITGRIKQGYGTIQRDIMTSDVSIYAKGVYCLLVSYAGEKQSCFPSLRTICENLKISKPTVIKSLKELIQAKLLTADKSRTKMGDFANNIYYPMYILDTPLVVNQIDTPNDSQVQSDLPPVVNQVDTKNNTIKKSISKDIDTPTLFKTEVKEKRFAVPSIDDVKEYFIAKGAPAEYERFFDFYQSKGWMVGKNKMKDWKSAGNNWIRGIEKGTSKEEPVKKLSF